MSPALVGKPRLANAEMMPASMAPTWPGTKKKTKLYAVRIAVIKRTSIGPAEIPVASIAK